MFRVAFLVWFPYTLTLVTALTLHPPIAHKVLYPGVAKYRRWTKWTNAMPKMGLVLDETERGRADEGPDHLFYQSPRLCLHADHESLGQLSKLYKQIVPDGGRVLDLCSSWVSHLPEGVKYAHVEGHGMNTAELWCNYALDGFFKRDLNQENRVLPLDSKSMDAVLCCCGWQYLKYPEDIAREVGRVLVPGAPLVISFTDSCFPSKALQGWIGRDNTARKQLVSDCLKVCGFEAIKEKEIKCQIGGPSMSVVIGQAPSKPCHGQAKEMVEKQGTQGGPKIDASRLMGVLAAMPEAKQRWQARFYELTQAAESLGIPRYGMPVLLTSASETEIREVIGVYGNQHFGSITHANTRFPGIKCRTTRH